MTNWLGQEGLRTEVSPALFWKWKKSALILQKSALILEKRALFVCINGLNSHLKYSLRDLGEKHRNSSLQSPSFDCHTWNVYQNAPIPRNLLCPEKVLVARL